MPAKGEVISSLAISVFLALVGLWAPFLHLYLLNASNLTLPLSVHLSQLGLLSALVVGVGFIIQILTPPRYRTAVSCVLLFIGIFLWAEGTLLIGNFGFLQGGDIDWDGNQYLLYLEILLMGFLGFLAFRLKGKLIRNAVLITSLLTVSSLPNFYPSFQENRSHSKTPAQFTFTQENLLQLSPEKNVLLFIIDTLQSDIFAEVITDHPEWMNTLDGFTYFPDATSAFPKTYASIPNILTGQAFDNSLPFPQYMHDAYLGNSAPKVLKDHGFDVRFRSFSWQPYFAHPDVANNLSDIGSSSGRKWMQRREFVELCNLALFRLSPFLAKPWVYNENEFRIKDSFIPESPAETPYTLSENDQVYSSGNDVEDLEFLDQMMAFLSADGDQPTFRVFHFRGTHAPINLDRDLNFIGKQPRTRQAVLAQTEAMLQLLALVFQRLRQVGAYDNSLIFVIGDHGAGEFYSIGIQKEALLKLGLDTKFSIPEKPAKRTLIQGGIPALMAKRIGENGRLKILPTPLELSDIPNTIFHELGFAEAATGPSLFGIPRPSERIRYHRKYRFVGWGQDYIVPLTEYQISGFSWSEESWSPTGRDLNRQAVDSIDGQLIVLGKGGNMDDFDHEGWSTPNTEGRRIVDGLATITIPTGKLSGAMALEIRVLPIQSPVMPVPLTLFINGENVVTWTLPEISPQILRTLIPANQNLAETDLQIRLELDEDLAGEPLVIEMRVQKAPERQSYSTGTAISFSGAGNAGDFQDHPWGNPESWGTWTRGHSAKLYFALDPLPTTDLEVEARFRTAIFNDLPPLLVDVIANGKTVTQWSLAQSAERTETFRVPEALFRESGILDLYFSIRNPRAPKDYKKSNDPRKLGLGFMSLMIRELGNDELSKQPTLDELPVQVAPFQLDINPADRRVAQWTGIYPSENWAGVMTTWTEGEFTCIASWDHPMPPRHLSLDIAATGPGGSPLTIEINGTRVATGMMVQANWSGTVDISMVPPAKQLEITLTCDTFMPHEINSENIDQRHLGIALRKITLVE